MIHLTTDNFPAKTTLCGFDPDQECALQKTDSEDLQRSSYIAMCCKDCVKILHVSQPQNKSVST